MVAVDFSKMTVPNYEEDETPKTLPAETFRSQKFFDLERRAIFSKKWILATHALKFNGPGDYVSQTYAGYPYFVIMDKNREFKAFHNVCRHRAFPVVNQEKGHANILACKYHSWSYRFDGSLIKAPKFDQEVDFKKEENGLFPVHLHVTDKGFIFVNFSAEEPVSFEDHFGDLPDEWQHLPVEEYEFAYSWQVTGNYNWKTLMDGYQECYHCQVGHPGFAQALNLDSYKVVPFTNFARHTSDLSGRETTATKKDDNPPTFTFCYPSVGVTTTDTMFYMMRTVPVDAGHSRMEYDVFKKKDVSMEALRTFMEFYEQVEQEDFDLCEATQRALNAGVYSKGRLNSARENGVFYYQQRTLTDCLEHFKLEQKEGHEIHPARPDSQSEECTASKLCSALSGDDSKSSLAW